MADNQPTPRLTDDQEKCPHCGAPKKQWSKQNILPSYPLEYDWYCGRCGRFIRESSH